MSNKPIYEMNRTELLAALQKSMPPLDGIKNHWLEIRRCENQIETYTQNKAEFLKPYMKSYIVNRNKSKHPIDGSTEAQLLYYAKMNRHFPPKVWFGVAAFLIVDIIVMTVIKPTTNKGMLIAWAVAIAAIIFAIKVPYKKYEQHIFKKAEQQFDEPIAGFQQEIQNYRNAIWQLESNNADVIEFIPPAYRNSYSVHSLYDIIINGRARTWERAAEVFEADKARNKMVHNSEIARQNSEIAVQQSYEAKQIAEDSEWSMQQSQAAMQRSVNEANMRAAEAERTAWMLQNK